MLSCTSVMTTRSFLILPYLLNSCGALSFHHIYSNPLFCFLLTIGAFPLFLLYLLQSTFLLPVHNWSIPSFFIIFTPIHFSASCSQLEHFFFFHYICTNPLFYVLLTIGAFLLFLLYLLQSTSSLPICNWSFLIIISHLLQPALPPFIHVWSIFSFFSYLHQRTLIDYKLLW